MSLFEWGSGAVANTGLPLSQSHGGLDSRNRFMCTSFNSARKAGARLDLSSSAPPAARSIKTALRPPKLPKSQGSSPIERARSA